jgi:integrase
MASAWIYQDSKQLRKHGAEEASWYVGWIDPEGKRRCKSCGPGEQGRRNAMKLRDRTEAQLLTGTYGDRSKTAWADFRKEYEEKVLAGLAVQTQITAKASLDAFERHVKPSRVAFITTAVIDQFIARRRSDPGAKRGSTVSAHTINHDLRHVKAALGVAEEWGYLPAVPKVRMERTVKQLPVYVTGEHFAALYGACSAARLPEGLTYPASDWWRALLVMGYMTGWRIGDMLSLSRVDLDLDAGTAVTRGADNKGKRDELVKLHPVVLEHLRQLPGFTPSVLPWPHDRRTLYEEFLRIQQAAGINLPCRVRGAHEHTPHCHAYGFHDLRRAFATMNADKLTPDALQALMRHRSYQTTQVYINMARQMDQAVASLHVPDVLKKGAGAS